MDSRFLLLGPFEVTVLGRSVQVTGAKARALLATLLLEPGRIVPVEQLATALWDDDPPRSAVANLRTHASALRRQLAGDPAIRLTGSAVGYRLEVDPGGCDAAVFGRLTDAARAHAAAGRVPLAVEHLQRALRLWRGDAGADLVAGAALRARLRVLDERRADAVEDFHRLRLDDGDRDAGMVDELRAWVRRYPLRERLWALLVRALDQAGRPAEALDAYREVFDLLRDELGIEPGAELRRLQAEILHAAPGPARPRQLPSDVPAFVGRDAEIDRLTATDRPWLITGPGGIGKSALAVHLGHRLAGRFPDGQLYVDLLGSTNGAVPLRPATVLARFLRACGLDGAELPTDEAELVGAYRSAVAGRRLLIVLDNARDAAQIRPLLPGAPGCAVLVTSRSTMGSLPGVRHLHLGELSAAQAVAMLGAIVDDGRPAADPDGARRLAGLCGHMPLALVIAAARLVSRPEWTPGELAGRLAAGHRVGELSQGGLALAACFEVGYSGVAPEAATAFRLLGMLNVPEPGLEVVAAMLRRPGPVVRAAVESLVDGRLAGSPAPDRYRLHDLLRAYARELAAQRDDPAEVTAAVRRALSWYVGAARAAIGTLRPGSAFTGAVAAPPIDFASPADAVAWLDAERANLVAATVSYAADPATASLSVALGEALNSYLGVHGHFADWGTVAAAALAAARLAGDPAGEGRALSALAGVHMYAEELDAARDCLTEALTLAEAGADRRAKVRALSNLGTIAHRRHAVADSLAAFRRAHELNAEGGDPQTGGVLLNNIGSVLLEADRSAEALDYLHSSLTLFRGLGDPVGEALALGNLGRAHAATRDYAAAVATFDRCLALAREFGDRQAEYDTLVERATVHLAMGRPGPALADAQDALPLCREAGDRDVETRVLGLLESVRRAA